MLSWHVDALLIHLHVKYEKYPRFPRWDIMLSSFLKFDLRWTLSSPKPLSSFFQSIWDKHTQTWNLSSWDVVLMTKVSQTHKHTQSHHCKCIGFSFIKANKILLNVGVSRKATLHSLSESSCCIIHWQVKHFSGPKGEQGQTPSDPHHPQVHQSVSGVHMEFSSSPAQADWQIWCCNLQLGLYLGLRPSWDAYWKKDPFLGLVTTVKFHFVMAPSNTQSTPVHSPNSFEKFLQHQWKIKYWMLQYSFVRSTFLLDSPNPSPSRPLTHLPIFG